MELNKMFCTTFIVLILLAGCGHQEEGQVARTTACGVSDRPVCRVSFRALATNPDRYDGRSVRVEGYLGVSRGLFVLSSSEESFEAGVTDETGVRIRGPVDLQRRVFDQHAYSWVSVAGAFRLRKKDESTDDLLLGEIHAPLDVRSLRIPGPVPRAAFEEVALDLEDLK